MKKRLLAVLLAMLLALGCLPAHAESIPAGLFRLICRDAQGQDTLLGTAVLIEGSTLLTAASAARCGTAPPCLWGSSTPGISLSTPGKSTSSAI